MGSSTTPNYLRPHLPCRQVIQCGPNEELSDERYELRKVEEFADSRLIRSDRIDLDLTTSLSWEPVLAIEEIAA